MILARLKTWALALAGVLAAIASAWLWGRRSGRLAQRQDDTGRDAQDAVQAAQDTIQAHEVRRDVEDEIRQLPDAPAQRLGDAAPGTAAGRLRDDGWLRDQDSGAG